MIFSLQLMMRQWRVVDWRRLYLSVL